MATCADVAGFLQQVNVRDVTAPLPPADLATLQQLGLLQVLTKDQVDALSQEVAQLEQAQRDYANETWQRSSAASGAMADAQRTHSILFHLEGVDRERATLERLAQEQAAVKSLDDDLARRQQQLAQLLIQRGTLQTACPMGDSYVAIQPAGRITLRDLGVRLYRLSDQPFAAYWDETAKTDAELATVSTQSAGYAQTLIGQLPTVHPSDLWAVGISLAKSGGDAAIGIDRFLGAYRSMESLTVNLENRVMAAEVLAANPRDLSASIADMRGLLPVLKTLKVPSESAVGVASILVLGQRADGTYATGPLEEALKLTKSLEAAALLAIDNRPYEGLRDRFLDLAGQFDRWGYAASEDVELSCAYLALSDLPTDTIGAKLAILTRGLAGYLEYPLAGAAILASIPVLEANETLNLLERAYEVLGARTGPMAQSEIICLAIRLIHGIRIPGVNELDATARVVAPSLSYGAIGPRFWVPVIIVHSGYYSTFSGIGGAHPGHVHGWGGGGFGGGFVG